MNAVAPLIPCIVSGGSGTRLWPVSRESMPKPFMRLADDQSLLQKTFLRIAGLPDVARLLTVTNRDLLFRTLDDYRAVNRSGLAQDLLLEPMGRNTAPAIAAAALHVQEHFGDQAQLLILPADHLIRDEQAFAAAVAEARGLAAQGYLVTFGITPERAETGFGYIEQGAPLGNGFRVAVDTPDALLVADAARSQDVKFVAQELKRRGHDAFRLHRTVSRPWGTYTVLEEGRRFKIKRIVVRPKASLSLQMHHHRSEHWIVVSGMALVENGEREFLLNTNESTFIPAGHSHRLSNPGIIDLVMIEVQSGEYLGEDDIVRFNDIYGRAPASDEKKA